jgi:hypothetical protein
MQLRKESYDLSEFSSTKHPFFEERFTTKPDVSSSPKSYKTTKTTASMTTEEVTCRVLAIKPYGSDENVSLAEKSARVCLKDCPNTAIETRLLWARDIAKEFLASSTIPSGYGNS